MRKIILLLFISSRVAGQTIQINKEAKEIGIIKGRHGISVGAVPAPPVMATMVRWIIPPVNQATVVTNYSTFKKTDRDILFVSGGNSQPLVCDFSNTTYIENWHITFELAYPEAGEPGDNFIDILDVDGKVILRISRPETFPVFNLKANDITLASSNNYAFFGRLNPISIYARDGLIEVKFSDYETVILPLFDLTANINKPRFIKIHHHYLPGNRGHQTNIARLKFFRY